jgi:hypothetical protein
MLKSDVEATIKHHERIKVKAYSLDTEEGDKKAVLSERVIIQCKEVLRSMRALDSEVTILEGMIY